MVSFLSNWIEGIVIAVIIALIASGVILLGQIKRRRTSVISEEVK